MVIDVLTQAQQAAWAYKAAVRDYARHWPDRSMFPATAKAALRECNLACRAFELSIRALSADGQDEAAFGLVVDTTRVLAGFDRPDPEALGVDQAPGLAFAAPGWGADKK
jgi:hypothetical protein